MPIINSRGGGWLAVAGLLALMAGLLCPQELSLAKSGSAEETSGEQSGVRRSTGAPAIASPTEVLGFTPGAPRELAGWEQLLSYYRQVDRQSDRLALREIGRTALGRPLVMLTISAAVEPVRPVILLSAGLDPTAVGGTLTLTRLIHHLLTDRSPEVEQILARTTIIIVPSLNPDGLALVTEWYRRTLGTPAEGSPPPQPAHHYAGDELGEDWQTLTQPETRAVVDKVFRQFDPEIWLDLRQFPGPASRERLTLAVPQVWQARQDNPTHVQLAKRMVRRLNEAGRQTLLTGQAPDSEVWPPFFNGRGLRLATASARLATPIRAGAGAGNPGLPDWTLADIVESQFAASIAMLAEVAEKPASYQTHSEPPPSTVAGPSPVAYLIPEPTPPSSISETYQRLASGLREAATGEEEELHERSEQLLGEATSQPSTSREVAYFYRTEGLDRLLAILRRGGVEVWRADEPFVAAGRSWPAGTHIVRMDRPGANFAATILDPHGPESLPRLLNVEVVRVRQEFSAVTRPEPAALVLQDRVRENGGIRVGIYRHQSAPADEAWMRWVFDQYRFGHSTLDDGQLRAGDLAARFDAIILPDQPVGSEASGSIRNSSPRPGEAVINEVPDRDGIAALRQFVEAGGTLLTFNRASTLAITAFRLPVRNVLAGREKSLTGRTGAVLRIQVTTDHQLGFGMESEAAVWFDNGPAFEILDPARARSIATYPSAGPLLHQGSLTRPGRWRGREALVEVALGRGRVILFGFRPHYRGRSLVTYPFIFNALMTSGH